ncbi:DUF2484 family protein [Rhodovulum tesquicola]|uniref:Uncharacterized protein DUF2484 n=1 Tax=Rhodovulum steppense TaxID=540251 RepID=A0A4R1YTQ2_9RHOB|nr:MULTISPECIES: DUF2484 family protein [Rhodovulum]MCO8144152.1 DUF2484 family protein [Rhodovulum tesquicola]TCM84442.1 uncharacterized protein DUF2484 [Rhodovulum steppense]
MTVSLILACLWVVVAAGLGMLPQRYHWPAAYGLIALGIPLLGYVTYQNGPMLGMVAMAAGVSVLRWPTLYLLRWLARPLRRGQREE